MIGRFVQETNNLFEQEKYEEVYDLCYQELNNFENIGRDYNDEERHYIATIYSTMAQIVEDDEALKCLDCAISFVPNSASLYYQRADVKKNISDFKGAVADYSIIVENAPTSEAYIHRALAKFSLRDFKGVISDCSKALEITPDLVHAYGFRGEAKMQMEDYESALDDFRYILQLDPDNIGAKKAFVDLKSIISKEGLTCMECSLKTGERVRQFMTDEGVIQIPIAEEE